MKNIKVYFFAIVFSVIASMVAVGIALPSRSEFSQTSAQKQESVYDRVLRTGKIRCGYFSWYPGFIKDATTGEYKGILYDVVTTLGRNLNLVIEWQEEIALGEVATALAAGRIDAFCSPLWITAERARVTDFVMPPLYYMPLYAFAREGDSRFDQDIFIANDGQYLMATLEGGATAHIQRELFPNAKPYELPQLTSPAELFTSLALGKADVAIYDLFTYGEFNTHNPGKVKLVSTQPIKVFANVMSVKPGENELRQMLSHAILELHLSGTIEKIIRKHENYPNAILRVAKPYDFAQ